MSTILVEQRLPIIIQLISRVPAYAQVLASVIAFFIFWDVGEELVDRTPIKSSNPFSKLAAPVKMMVSPSLARVRPYARRMSLPARRLTEHFATAIATPFHHRRGSVNLDVDSYFALPDVRKVEDKVEPEIMVTVMEVEAKHSMLEQDVGVSDALPHSSTMKVTKFKRMTKKAKALLGIRRRL